ncbi:MAG: TetR/AcrR family transcriptional regulator [Bacteroidia bacterium]
MARSLKFDIKIDDKVFIKDPESSVVGKNILCHGILLINEIGFEAFTFKKLATRIGITEPSVYRYFENKHKFLLYLLAWYWTWMEYKIILATQNIPSAGERLIISIKLLTAPIVNDPEFEHIDEKALYQIVISESSKVYLTKNVDEENKEGLFIRYKRLCRHVADIIREVNPDYRFPAALISTVIESSHDQKFFAGHLPSLTEVTSNNLKDATEFLTDLVFKTIKPND